MLNFLKELPTIYLVFFAFLILIFGFFFTKDSNLFTLANLALGAIVGIARAKGGVGQDVETQNIDKVYLPEGFRESNDIDAPVFHKKEARDE